MRKVLLVLAMVVAFAAASVGPASHLVSHNAPACQHAEVIIGPPGGG